MDPNHLWNQMTQVYGLHGLNIMEQAALSSGLSPQISHYSVSSTQNLQEQSAYKGAPITSPSQQASALANPLSSRLPPVSSLNQKTERSVFPEYLREQQSSSSIPPALVHSENNKWNLSSFVPEIKLGLGDPPPAHSGAKSSSQAPHRPRDYQSEQAALVELLKQQQVVQQQSEPPKAHQPLQSSKYLDSYADKYQVLDKYPSIQSYPDSIPKYQESLAQKYKDPVAQKYEDKYGIQQKYQQESLQKYKYPDSIQRFKSGNEKYQSDYSHEPGERYQEERSSSRSTQLHKMLSSTSHHSYTEPSPPSHDSSPLMGHNSPQIQPNNSPQMTSHHIQHQPTYSTTYSGTVNSPSSYIITTTPSAYTVSGENINMYEAISPVAATSTPSSLNYNTVNLDSLAQLSSDQQKLPVHQNSAVHVQHQMQIPSPTVTPYDQQPSPMSVASPTSTVPQQPQTVRAQADSTTKSKRGRGRGSSRGVRGGNKGGTRKKKDEQIDASPDLSSLHMQQHLAGSGGHSHMISPQPLSHSIGNNLSLSSPIMTCPPGQAISMQPSLVEGMAHGYEVSGINDEAMLQIQMAQGLLGMGESPSLRAEQEAILMMNNENSPFINPSEQMNCPENLKSGEDSAKTENTIEDNVGLGLSTVEHKPIRTKAAQKQKIQQDEEFAHLASDSLPQINCADVKQEIPAPQANKQISKPKDGSFQSSFLSFLQGNKQETLSSVTNSSITNKPELPKYIPEPPRPKPKPKSPSPPLVEKKTNEIKLKPETVTFSDDEESSQGSSSVQINKTVQGVISNLSDDSTGNKLTSLGGINKKLKAASEVKTQSPFRPQKPVVSSPPSEQRKPLTLKIKMSDIKMPIDNPKSKSPSKKLKSPGLIKGKSRRKSSIESEPCEVISDDEIPLITGKFAAKGQADREPSPVIPRQRSSRKAKEKVEEKRKARSEKKKKKKKKSKVKYESEESDVSSDPYYEDDSDEDKDYDSDKDPVWIPGEKPPIPGEDESEKLNRLAGLMKSKPRTTPKPLNSRRRKTQSSDEEFEEPLIPLKRSKSQSTSSRQGGSGGDTPKPNPTSRKNVIVEECDSDDNSPHQYMKGDFVMEKKELCNPDKYIIWKIDAGKLIQKFEPFILDGNLAHKSLSTYSSWSDYFKPNYMGINVRSMTSMKNHEVVQVLEDYQPKPADEHLEKDARMENFNVYVQILVSQALEPGFLSLVKQQDEAYYTAPLEKMEKILEEKKKQLAEINKWTSQFQEIVDKYPLLRIAEKYTVDQNVHCQASVTGSEEVALKTARLYGDPYNYETLDKVTTGQLTVDKAIEFHIGELAGKYLRQYHRIHHFKYRIYKKCLYMVDCCRRAGGKDTSEVLDQCLQNRVWVQNLFRELKKLLECEDSNQATTTNNTESAQMSTNCPPEGTSGSTPEKDQPEENIVAPTQSQDIPVAPSGVEGVNDTSLNVQEPLL